MALSDVHFYSPRSITEALKLLEEFKEARILAGGTDLLVDIKEGLIKVKKLISLQEIKELRKIEKNNGMIRIGALVTPQQILSDSLINQYIPALADASRSMASSQIRSMATVGGNIASAVPSADLPPPLIAAEASVELQCSESSRKVNLSEFFRGPRETVCQARELLTSVYIPLPQPSTGIAFQKFALREASALAVASVASRITLKTGRIKKAIIVLGAVAPTPVRALKASKFLYDNRPSDKLFERAAKIAKEEGNPISDIRGSVWYRKELIQVLTYRALTEALSRIQGKYKRGT